MTRSVSIEQYTECLQAARSIDAVADSIRDLTKSLGFQFYALGHHACATSPEAVRIANYPSPWTVGLMSPDCLSDDPVVCACEKAIVGFRWSEIPGLIRVSHRHKRILAQAKEIGLGEGFTIPIRVPGEPAGSCSFVTGSGKAISSRMLPAAQYMGCVAFEAARRTAKNTGAGLAQESARPIPQLSSRQLDCLTLAAQGKSDVDAGCLLGISNQTVHEHIEIAKRRYGVATRTQLIVRALFDSQLAFQDIIAW